MDRPRLAVLALAAAAIIAACNSSSTVTAPPPPPPGVALHDTTPFPLTGKHITTPCAGCHADTLYANTPTACHACHIARHPDRGECSNCHNTRSFIG